MLNSRKAASHIPLLVRTFNISQGDVLEVGTGFFSTTILHWLGAITGRKIVSYESDPLWYGKAKRYQCDYHDIIFVKNWDAIPLEGTHWGLVFIDHTPALRRAVEIERLKDSADYIVVHDTEPRAEKYYQYSRIEPLFKYRFDSQKVQPWTSVFSNLKELNNL